jgi:hypothetical protein
MNKDEDTKVKVKGSPLTQSELNAKTESFEPIEIRRAVKEANSMIKPYLESE